MRLNFHLTLKSGNHKTGPIPVSTTSADSCPPHCPLAEMGCYAKSGKLAIHWNLVTAGERGTNLDAFCERIAALPDGQLWRHNQAGDLPGKNDVLDTVQVRKLVKANRRKRGFTYTHYPPTTAHNARVIRSATKNGFTVNLSADNLREADAFKAMAIAPVTVVVGIGQRDNMITPAGNLVVICPAATHKDVTCASCKLCAWSDREVIIGFPAHGASRRKAELVTIQGGQLNGD